ncbi:MAG: hypothetical protein AAF825_10395, partial [Pseudomonadota bacterium]
MAVMSKPLIFVVLLALSCLAAALFGALHNQVSFTIGPDYFYAIKFPQFRIEALPPRGGAAIVGVLASWWMGPIIGLPAFVIGLIAVPTAGRYFRAGLRAIAVVFAATGIAALIGLALGIWRVSQGIDPGFWIPAGAEAADIIRAGSMHNASYAGGALGAVIAAGMIWRSARMVRANAT